MANIDIYSQMCAAVKHTHCVFEFDGDANGNTKTIGGVTWNVPPGVFVTSDTAEASGQFCSYLPIHLTVATNQLKRDPIFSGHREI